jgi:hypothetical protein
MSDLAGPATAARPDYGVIARRGLIAALVAAALNAGVALALAALLDAPGDYGPLQLGPVIASTVLAVLMGTVVYAVLAREAGRAERLFPRVAWTVAIVTLLMPLSLLAVDNPITEGEAGATVPLALLTGILHLLPAAVLVRLLPGSAQRERRS